MVSRSLNWEAEDLMVRPDQWNQAYEIKHEIILEEEGENFSDGSIVFEDQTFISNYFHSVDELGSCVLYLQGFRFPSVRFINCTFEKHVCLSGANFEGYVYFEKCEFKEGVDCSAWFATTKISNGILLEDTIQFVDCVFVKKRTLDFGLCLSNSEFGGSVVLENCSVLGGLNVDKSEFLGELNVKGARSSIDGVQIRSCTFKKTVQLEGINIKGDMVIQSSECSRLFQLKELKIQGGFWGLATKIAALGVWGCDIQSQIKLESCTLGGEDEYIGAIIADSRIRRIDLSSVRVKSRFQIEGGRGQEFSKTVEQIGYLPRITEYSKIEEIVCSDGKFEDVFHLNFIEFASTVAFKHTLFEGPFQIENCQFHDRLMLPLCSFDRGVELNDCLLRFYPVLDGVSSKAAFLWTPQDCEELDKNIQGFDYEETFRVLKTLMKQQNNHEMEHKYFADELKAKSYKAEKWTTKAWIWCYGSFSDFGRSTMLPAMWLLGMWWGSTIGFFILSTKIASSTTYLLPIIAFGPPAIMAYKWFTTGIGFKSLPHTTSGVTYISCWFLVASCIVYFNDPSPLLFESAFFALLMMAPFFNFKFAYSDLWEKLFVGEASPWVYSLMVFDVFVGIILWFLLVLSIRYRFKI